MKKLLFFATALIFAFSLKAVVLPAELEIDPQVTSCRIVYRQPVKKLEYRQKDGKWLPLPLLEKSPVESSRWRGDIKNLKPETAYEVRVQTPRGRYIVGSFVTQAVVPEKVLKLTPTFENCSVELPDHLGKNCQIEYRKSGGQWQKALDPVWFPDERCWRGVLLQLQENTFYKVRVIASGEKVTGSFKTLDSKFPIAQTIVIPKLPFKIRSGKPGAYIRYTADAPLKGTLTLDKVQYVVLDGIRLDGDHQPVGLHLNFCRNVAITNCEFSNCGARSVRTWERNSFGQHFYQNKKSVLFGSGSLKITACTNVLVERCLFYRPAGKTNSWQFSHPTGPEGIVMNCARSGVVIRYNDFAARDLARWNDCIACIGNGCSDGGFGSNADIYGNYFSFANDDACELEGAGRNLRFYRNRIEQVLAGISTGRCSYGPVYLIRNLLVNAGDQHGHFTFQLKNGMQAQGKGTVFFLHNTVAAAHGGLSWIFGPYHKTGPVIPLPEYKGFSRGNVFISRQDIFPYNFFTWPGSYDFDVLGKGKEDFKNFLKKHKQEKNAIWENPRFLDPARGNYFLIENSPGWNFAPVPGLQGVKHAGACQEKDQHAQLGRPLALSADAIYASTAGNEVSFTVTAQKATSFQVKTNDDFYTVQPVSGTLKAGEKQKFTVSCNSDHTPYSRICRGVFFIRQPDGCSLPLGFAFDRRKNPYPGREVPNGKTFDVVKDEICFFYVKGRSFSGEGVLELNQKKINVQFQPYRRSGTEIVRLIDKNTGRILRIQLAPGKYQLKITGNKKSRLIVKSLIVTTEPDLVFNGKLQEEF